MEHDSPASPVGVRPETKVRRLRLEKVRWSCGALGGASGAGRARRAVSRVARVSVGEVERCV